MHRMMAAVRRFFGREPWLISILVVAVLFRLVGLLAGLPVGGAPALTLHPDEIVVLRGAIEFPGHVVSNTNFAYPTFFAYGLALVSAPLQFGLRVAGVSPDAVTDAVLVMGRLVSVTAGVGAVLLTYLLARDLYDRKRALLAAALLCLATYHVHNASFLTPDVLTSFLLLLLLVLLRKAFAVAEWPRFVMAGVAFGVLLGTKYTGAVALVMVGVLYLDAVYRASPRHSSTRDAPRWPRVTAYMGLLLLAAGATFLVATPGVFFQRAEVAETFAGLHAANVARNPAPFALERLIHVFRGVVGAAGLPLTLLFFVGVIWPFQKRAFEWGLVAVVVAYVGYLGTALLSRYVIMMLPLMTIVASHGVLSALQGASRPIRALRPVVIGGALMYGLVAVVHGVYWRTNDTRVQATRFVAEHVPESVAVGMAYTRSDRPAMQWEVAGGPWRFLSWAYPSVDFERFRYQDFMTYPEIVVATSVDTMIHSGFPAVTAKLLELWDDSGRYRPIARFAKTLWNPLGALGIPLPLPEFSSPEIVVYGRRAPGAATTARTYYDADPDDYFGRGGPRDWLSLDVSQGSRAQMEPGEDPEAIRVVADRVAGGSPWTVRLLYDAVAVAAGTRYTVSFRARAGRPRPIAIAAVRAHGDRDPLGLYAEYTIGPEWRQLDAAFVAEDDEANAGLYFALGSDTGMVELSDISLRMPDGTPVVRNVPEFYVAYRFNQMGCRDRDYPRRRESGTVRLLVLGDSHALGTGVHVEDTYPNRLEDALNEAAFGTTRYEVINCGIAGAGVREAAWFFETTGEAYDPDLVLLTLAPGDAEGWLDQLGHGVAVGPHAFDVGYASRPSASGVGHEGLGEWVVALGRTVAETGARLMVVVPHHTGDPAWGDLLADVTPVLDSVPIPWWDGGPPMRAALADGLLTVTPRDAHPNARAHGVIVRELKRFLTSGILREVRP